MKCYPRAGLAVALTAGLLTSGGLADNALERTPSPAVQHRGAHASSAAMAVSPPRLLAAIVDSPVTGDRTRCRTTMLPKYTSASSAVKMA